MKSCLLTRFAALSAILAACSPLALHAQELPYDDVAGEGDSGDVSDSTGVGRGPRVTVSPYIEASQVLLAELSPGSESLTYSSLAAGIDASFAGRNNQGSVSVRYERRFGWGKKAADSDTLSGIARFQTAVVPRALNFEVGALAARSSVENNGSTVSGLEFGDSATQVYSAYAGPSLATRMGDVAVNGHYYFGYTRVDSPNAIAVVPGQNPVDVLDDATRHNAELHFGTKAGEPLPVGIGAGVGWNREDISNLDQRINDFHARGDVAVPLTSDLQLVAGVGWEKVEVSSRDALRDTVTGLPVLDSNGRYVTDSSAPRQIAFESEGLIWDAGVMWRPSKRTALEAHVARRYGYTNYYGSFAYAPSARTSINISAYDSLTSFGGTLNKALANLPTDFEAVRNPLNGDLGGCVAARGSVASGQSGCLIGVLGSVRSAVFRGRGVMASVGYTGSRFGYGVGAGYDRRRFIAVPGTVLGVTNLTIDENIWLAAYLNGKLDANSSIGLGAWANWYQSGDALAGNSNAVGATASYNRSITSRLSATAALGITGVNREALADIWTAQALAGVRYAF